MAGDRAKVARRVTEAGSFAVLRIRKGGACPSGQPLQLVKRFSLPQNQADPHPATSDSVARRWDDPRQQVTGLTRPKRLRQPR